MGRRFSVGIMGTLAVGDVAFAQELGPKMTDATLDEAAEAGRILLFRTRQEDGLDFDVSFAEDPTPRPAHARLLVQGALLQLPTGHFALPLMPTAIGRKTMDVPPGPCLVELWHDPTPERGVRQISNRSCLLLALLANAYIAGIALPRAKGLPILAGAVVVSLAWWLAARVRRRRTPPPPRTPDFFLVLQPLPPEVDVSLLKGAVIEHGWSARR